MKRQYSLIIFIWILKITNWNEQFFKLLFFFFFKCESCSVVSDSLWHHGLYSSWNFPGQNTGVNSCSLLQGIFPTQGLNPGIPHHRGILYQLSHQGSPWTLGCMHFFQFRVNFSGYMFRSGIAGSYGGCIFNFVKKLYTVLHSVFTNLHPHQWLRRVPFSPHPL